MVEKVGIMPFRLAERKDWSERKERKEWGGVQSIVHPLFRKRRSLAVGRRAG